MISNLCRALRLSAIILIDASVLPVVDLLVLVLPGDDFAVVDLAGVGLGLVGAPVGLVISFCS